MALLCSHIGRGPDEIFAAISVHFRRMINENYCISIKQNTYTNCIQVGDRYHFLSRPRRFGKSLLLSTLKELFLGNKELFKDLWIEQSNFSFFSTSCYLSRFYDDGIQNAKRFGNQHS